jgi:ferric-dicitrate binding protein FerR (iron transport regulator)
MPSTAYTEESYKPSRRKKIWIWSLATASVLAAAFLFAWRNYGTEVTPTEQKTFSEVSTKPGSKTKLVLPDSSVVWLNAGSKLTYNEQFGVKNRNATLTGEAFFEVKKTGIPFIIQTNSVQIKVLGTSFNVRSYPDEKTTETSLIHGKVEITLNNRPGEKYTLKPNEKLIIANEPEKILNKVPGKKEPLVMISSLTHLEDSTIIETSWVENKLVFRDESFADVARKMERWYGVTIEFTDEAVARYHLYGSFTRENITEALDALRIGFHFNYRIEGEKILIAK